MAGDTHSHDRPDLHELCGLPMYGDDFPEGR